MTPPNPTKVAVALILGLAPGFPAASDPHVQDREPAAPTPSSDPIEIEWSNLPLVAYRYQRIEPVIRIEVGPDFAESSLVQPFRRELDLPLRIEVDGWNAPEGALAPQPLPRESRDRAAGGPQLLLNGSLARARFEGHRGDGPRRRAVYTLTGAWIAEGEGLLELAPPILRYTTLQGGRLDPFGDPIAGERLDRVVRGNPASIEVRALPEEGRPEGHIDAVGVFLLESRVEPRGVDLGDSVELILEIRGVGNLMEFTPPHLDRIGAFHGRGWRQKLEPGLRTLVYDLAPRSEGSLELPAVPFSYFDPAGTEDTGPGYRTLFSAPATIEVYPPRRPGSESPPETSTESHAPTPGESAAESGTPSSAPAGRTDRGARWARWVLPVVGITFLLALLSRLAGRRAAVTTEAEVQGLLRSAIERSGAAVATVGVPDAKALGDALALALGVSTVSPEVEPLAKALEVRGVPPERSWEIAGRFVALDHGRFGGPPVPVPEGGWSTWLDELEGVLRSVATRGR